jgi:oxygen-independent coproporphyrinogen-3 oxidase
MATLQAWGALVIDGDWLRLTREGLLQVDRLVHEFFLPEHRTARYA